MSKSCEDRHTSKSKLKLGDKILKGVAAPGHPDLAGKKKRGKPPSGGFMEIIGELPQPIRTMGPKQFEALKHYRSSVVVYGATAVLAMCYFCEWKAVLQYLPYYNGKYKDEK